eukprot:Polyplicarium_translucidae@DN2666_c0_g1_i3.p1
MLSAERCPRASCQVAIGRFLVALSPVDERWKDMPQHLHQVDLESGHAASTKLSIREGKSWRFAGDPASGSGDIVALTNGESSQVYDVATLEIRRADEGIHVMGRFDSTADIARGTAAVTALTTKDATLRIFEQRTAEPASELILSDNALMSQSRGSIKAVAARKKGQQTRVMLSFADGTLALLRKSDGNETAHVEFVREEALTSIVAVAHVRLSDVFSEEDTELERAMGVWHTPHLSFFTQGIRGHALRYVPFWLEAQLLCSRRWEVQSAVKDGIFAVFTSLKRMLNGGPTRDPRFPVEKHIAKLTTGLNPVESQIEIMRRVFQPARDVVSEDHWSASVTPEIWLRRLLKSGGRAFASRDVAGDFGRWDIIFAFTCPKKIFAIHARTGQLLWARSLADWDGAAADAVPLSCHPRIEANPNIVSVASNGSPGGIPRERVPEEASPVSLMKIVEGPGDLRRVLSVVFRPSPNAPLTAVWLSPVDGSEISRRELPAEATRVASVANGGIVVLNAADEPLSLLSLTQREMPISTTVFFSIKNSNRAAEAFSVRESANGTWEKRTLWRFAFARDEKIIAASLPLNVDAPGFPVHVKSDATILSRPVKSQIMALVTDSGFEGVASLDTKRQPVIVDDVVDHTDEECGITLHVINSVDGTRWLSQCLPPGSVHPVNLLVFDNVVAVFARNQVSMRTELLLLELYEDRSDPGGQHVTLNCVCSGAWRILTKPEAPLASGFDASRRAAPMAFNSTFAFPGNVRACVRFATSLMSRPWIATKYKECRPSCFLHADFRGSRSFKSRKGCCPTHLSCQSFQLKHSHITVKFGRRTGC